MASGKTECVKYMHHDGVIQKSFTKTFEGNARTIVTYSDAGYSVPPEGYIAVLCGVGYAAQDGQGSFVNPVTTLFPGYIYLNHNPQNTNLMGIRRPGLSSDLTPICDLRYALVRTDMIEVQ